MIKDKNLKLMLIELSKTLTTKYSIGWDYDYEEFCATSFGKEIEFDWDSYKINTTVESFFLNLELPKDDLLIIEQLTLDGDYAIFTLLTEDFLTQEDYFVIKSLDGIQYCKNLKYLNLGTLTQHVNLEPLTHLSNLVKLALGSYNATNYKVLLQLKNLNTLEVYNWVGFSDDEKAELIPILKQLQKNNCELIFHPETSWED